MDNLSGPSADIACSSTVINDMLGKLSEEHYTSRQQQGLTLNKSIEQNQPEFESKSFEDVTSAQIHTPIAELQSNGILQEKRLSSTTVEAITDSHRVNFQYNDAKKQPSTQIATPKVNVTDNFNLDQSPSKQNLTSLNLTNIQNSRSSLQKQQNSNKNGTPNCSTSNPASVIQQQFQQNKPPLHAPPQQRSNNQSPIQPKSPGFKVDSSAFLAGGGKHLQSDKSGSSGMILNKRVVSQTGQNSNSIKPAQNNYHQPTGKGVSNYSSTSSVKKHATKNYSTLLNMNEKAKNKKQKNVQTQKAKNQINSNVPSNLTEKALKKLKFYRDFYKSEDKGMIEFLVNQEGNSFEGKLDPDKIGFPSPDFGFNNELNFEESDQDYKESAYYKTAKSPFQYKSNLKTESDSGSSLENETRMSTSPWRKFLDVVATYPKYERVQNYIKFVNQEKLNSMKKVVMGLAAVGMGGRGTNTLMHIPSSNRGKNKDGDAEEITPIGIGATLNKQSVLIANQNQALQNTTLALFKNTGDLFKPNDSPNNTKNNISNTPSNQGGDGNSKEHEIQMAFLRDPKTYQTLNQQKIFKNKADGSPFGNLLGPRKVSGPERRIQELKVGIEEAAQLLIDEKKFLAKLKKKHKRMQLTGLMSDEELEEEDYGKQRNFNSSPDRNQSNFSKNTFTRKSMTDKVDYYSQGYALDNKAHFKAKRKMFTKLASVQVMDHSQPDNVGGEQLNDYSGFLGGKPQQNELHTKKVRSTMVHSSLESQRLVNPFDDDNEEIQEQRSNLEQTARNQQEVGDNQAQHRLTLPGSELQSQPGQNPNSTTLFDNSMVSELFNGQGQNNTTDGESTIESLYVKLVNSLQRYFTKLYVKNTAIDEKESDLDPTKISQLIDIEWLQILCAENPIYEYNLFQKAFEGLLQLEQQNYDLIESPYQLFQIITNVKANKKILNSNQIASNAKLLLQLTRKLQQKPIQKPDERSTLQFCNSLSSGAPAYITNATATNQQKFLKPQINTHHRDITQGSYSFEDQQNLNSLQMLQDSILSEIGVIQNSIVLQKKQNQHVKNTLLKPAKRSSQDRTRRIYDNYKKAKTPSELQAGQIQNEESSNISSFPLNAYNQRQCSMTPELKLLANNHIHERRRTYSQLKTPQSVQSTTFPNTPDIYLDHQRTQMPSLALSTTNQTMAKRYFSNLKHQKNSHDNSTSVFCRMQHQSNQLLDQLHVIEVVNAKTKNPKPLFPQAPHSHQTQRRISCQDKRPHFLLNEPSESEQRGQQQDQRSNSKVEVRLDCDYSSLPRQHGLYLREKLANLYHTGHPCVSPTPQTRSSGRSDNLCNLVESRAQTDKFGISQKNLNSSGVTIESNNDRGQLLSENSLSYSYYEPGKLQFSDLPYNGVGLPFKRSNPAVSQSFNHKSSCISNYTKLRISNNELYNNQKQQVVKNRSNTNQRSRRTPQMEQHFPKGVPSHGYNGHIGFDESEELNQKNILIENSFQISKDPKHTCLKIEDTSPQKSFEVSQEVQQF